MKLLKEKWLSDGADAVLLRAGKDLVDHPGCYSSKKVNKLQKKLFHYYESISSILALQNVFNLSFYSIY